MSTELQQLQNLLNNEIPITRSLEISVTYYNGSILEITAPLKPNINHKSTAFGGSLYTLAVLSGWGLLHLKMHENHLNGHIVIQQSEADYIHPVTKDFVARASIEETTAGRGFKMFKKKGKTRFVLDTTIEQDGRVAMKMTGRYVIHS